MSLYWTALIVAFLIAFAAGETYALKNNKVTLSRYVVNASKAWPLLPFALGLIVGALGVHFFWPWCPDLGIGNG